MFLPIEPTSGFADLQPDRRVSVGIRPHDVHPAASSESAAIAVETTIVETLGPHVHVHGELAGTPFIAALEASHAVPRGTRLDLEVSDFHLFDIETGEALRVD
jgi:ABC-type sugar transport system ATPase subunit